MVNLHFYVLFYLFAIMAVQLIPVI